MLRAAVEEQTGRISDSAWQDTCNIVDSTLLARRNLRIWNGTRQVLILCVGIADAIVKGVIRKGAT